MLSIVTVVTWLSTILVLNLIHPNPAQPLKKYMQKLTWQRNALVVLFYMLPVIVLIIFNLLIPAESGIPIWEYSGYILLFLFSLHFYSLLRWYSPDINNVKSGLRLNYKHPQDVILTQMLDDICNHARIKKFRGRIFADESLLLLLNAKASVSSFPGKDNHIIYIEEDLFNTLSKEELYALIGHEVGHIASNDMAVQVHLNSLTNVLHYITPLVLTIWYIGIGFITTHSPSALIPGVAVFILLHFTLPCITGFVASTASRKGEYLSDAYAVLFAGKRPAWKMLKYFHDENQKELDEIFPDKWHWQFFDKITSRLFTTQPPISDRLDATSKMQPPSKTPDTNTGDH